MGQSRKQQYREIKPPNSQRIFTDDKGGYFKKNPAYDKAMQKAFNKPIIGPYAMLAHNINPKKGKFGKDTFPNEFVPYDGDVNGVSQQSTSRYGTARRYDPNRKV